MNLFFSFFKNLIITNFDSTHRMIMENDNLKKIIFYDQIQGFLDINFLRQSYNNGQLQGANIMAKLFNLQEETTFLSLAMETDENECLTFFRNSHICWEEWSLLLSFLKRGDLAIYHKYPDKIIKCYDLALKLGGIPSLEDYCHSLIKDWQSKSLLLKNYNPLTPKEDINQVYIWGICSVGTAEGKNITKLVGHNDYTYYHRELKENKNFF